MHAPDFASLYANTYRWSLTGKPGEALEVASCALGNLVLQRLEGKLPEGSAIEEVSDQINQHMLYAGREHARITSGAISPAVLRDDSSSHAYTSLVRAIVMTSCAHEAVAFFLSNGKQIPGNVLNRISYRLAMNSTAALLRAQRLRDRSDASAVMGLALAKGSGAESDTAIVLTEINKRRPHMHFVPSPPQFEMGAEPMHNSDYIVFDHLTNQAVGLQVKTAVRAHRRSDPQCIVEVDSAVDLSNTIGEKQIVKENGHAHVIFRDRVMPGLLGSLRLLDEKPGSASSKKFTSALEAQYGTRFIVQQRMLLLQQARTYQAYRPKLEEATKIIEARMAPHLGW